MGDPVRILYVEDDPSLGELIATVLPREDERFSVTTATSVADGLDRLSTEEFDCVISDYEMADRDGIEFLEAVRDRYPELPFILYTGKGSEEVASDAIAAGVTDYLQKEGGTSQYTVLANRVANAVDQYRSKRALEASRRRYRAVFDDPNILVGLLDTDGTVLDVNRTSIGYVDATREELAGESFWETPWFAGSDSLQAEVENWISRAAGGEYVDFEHDIDRSDRGVYTVSGVVRPVTDEEGHVVSLLISARDVTERKERERDLERLTERFRTLTEHGSDVITVIDEAGTIQYESPAIAHVLGYEPEELVGESAFEYVHPDDRDDTWEAFARAIERPETAMDRFEYRFKHADGSWVWVETVGSNRTDTAIGGYVLTTRDITARKEREHEFRRTNAVLSTLFETLPVGVLAEDPSRDVLAVNQRTFDLFGLSGSPEDVVGADCERIADDVSELFVDPEAFLERTAELVASSEEAEDEELALRDGRAFARSYRSIDLPDGAGHLWVYHDVTNRTERERQIEGLNETAQALMTADTREAVAEIGVEAARDVLNLEVNAIHLFEEGEGLVPVASTDTVDDLIGEPPTFTDEETSIAWRAYERGESTIIDDSRSDPDVYNPETPVRSELYLPIGEHGILLAGFPTREEFTQQDLAVGEILAGSLTTALEQVDRTEQLHARERELARQNRRLNEFTGIVSHDLRNPLTVAAGRLALAREEVESEHFDDIEHAHERMNRLIDDLLTLAREGKQVTDAEPVSLDELFRDCWRNVETAGATLDVDLDRTIRGDRSRLQQLVENLVRNAVEHSSTSPRSQARDDAVEHGSTSDDAVEHDSEDVRIEVGELEDGFYVEDDGPGIPEGSRETIFDSGYSTSAEGTGFGLPIARRVADAHGWTIRATEGADGGARFEITGVGSGR